ncbi:MAG: hypothetical protein AAF081_13815 [Actinomycetota bacterium]
MQQIENGTYDAPGKNTITVFEQDDGYAISVEGEVSVGLPGSPSINGLVVLSVDEASGAVSAEKAGNNFPSYEIYRDIGGGPAPIGRFQAGQHGDLIDGPQGFLFRTFFTDHYLNEWFD